MLYKLISYGYSEKQRRIYEFVDLNRDTVKLNSTQISSLMSAGHEFIGIRKDTLGRVVEDRRTTRAMPIERGRISLGYTVSTGKELSNLAASVTYNKKPRYAVKDILDNLMNYQVGRVCVVKGIRRTGKTTAIMHTIVELIAKGIPSESIAFIDIKQGANTAEVVHMLRNNNWEYLFIDEITNLPNILNELGSISNTLTAIKKVVLTGTDSYVWPIAITDALFDREMPIDLTPMSIGEYYSLFPAEHMGKKEKVEHFSRYSGVLRKESYASWRASYVSMQSALVLNITETITKNIKHERVRRHVGSLYGANEKQINYAILWAILQTCKTQGRDYFRATDEQISKKVRELLEEVEVTIEANGVNKDILQDTLKALMELNIIGGVRNIASRGRLDGVEPQGTFELICHINSLYNVVIRKADNDEERDIGSIFENMVRSQCYHFVDSVQSKYEKQAQDKEISMGYCRYKLSDSLMQQLGETKDTPEVDVVVTHRTPGKVRRTIIEAKHDDKPLSKHAKNLSLRSMEQVIGKIDRKLVVYNGETRQAHGVEFVNAYDFLMDIGKWVL